jgi:putative nucleotidyltransferase with HDIG domain
MCQVIITQGGYRFAWIGFLGQVPANGVQLMAHAGVEDGYLETIRNLCCDGGPGYLPVEDALRQGTYSVVQDIGADTRFAPWREAALQRGYGSLVVLPLRQQGEAIGALAIYASEADAFDEEALKLLAELAEDLAFGIHSLRIRTERDYFQTQHLNSAERIHQTLIGTIQAVAATIEKRDPYTAGHQQRTAALAARLASELGLVADRIEGIRLGAMIHDIGKIYIPAEILNRPGRLSTVEFNLIKVHPQVGYDIIKDVRFPWPVAEMVLQHHERLDGSGYPQGLVDEAITLEARILAVADVVEAMSSHRPYRPGLGIKVALDEIEKNRGRFYDPAVVDACLRLFREQGYQLEIEQY